MRIVNQPEINTAGELTSVSPDADLENAVCDQVEVFFELSTDLACQIVERSDS